MLRNKLCTVFFDVFFFKVAFLVFSPAKYSTLFGDWFLLGGGLTFWNLLDSSNFLNKASRLLGSKRKQAFIS